MRKRETYILPPLFPPTHRSPLFSPIVIISILFRFAPISVFSFVPWHPLLSFSHTFSLFSAPFRTVVPFFVQSLIALYKTMRLFPHPFPPSPPPSCSPLDSVAAVFDTLEYGPAPESPAAVNAWLDDHGREFGHFINNKVGARCAGSSFSSSLGRPYPCPLISLPTETLV
jgi:hypothetical protein